MTFSFGLMSCCLLMFTVAHSLKAPAPFDVDQLLFLNHANMTYAAPLQITAGQLHQLCKVGKGSVGEVSLVELEQAAVTEFREKYILKRVRAITTSTCSPTMEKFALESVNHPFIIQLRASLKDQNNFLFLMEQGCSPDLFDILVKQGPFNTGMAQFYVASIMLALEHLHSRGIIHRDLNLQNIVLGKDGFPRIIDFGAAKLSSDSSNSIVGTQRYLSPEMKSKRPHGTGVDWWALGHAMYEMVVGEHAFDDDADVRTAELEFPDTLDKDAADLIKKLLEKDPSKRLGVVDNSWKIITEHPWFAGFDWIKLLKRDVKVPVSVKDHRDGSCKAVFSS